MPSPDTQSRTGEQQSTARRRVGRPPKVDEHGVPTRERLLEAGARSFAENGFEATKLAEVARRADVSTAAVYTHFADKDEFLVEAAKWSLHRLGSNSLAAAFDPATAVRHFLSPEFADARRILLELHSVSLRHDHVAELLNDWFAERVVGAEQAGALSRAETMAFYLMVLGLCHIDAVSSADVSTDELLPAIDRMIGCLVAHRSS